MSRSKTDLRGHSVNELNPTMRPKTSVSPRTRVIAGLAVATSLLVLSGCSSLSELMSGDKIDYKSASSKGPRLDVPPDLSQLTREARYAVPGAAVTAAGFQAGLGQPHPVARSS